jgi:pirin-like protein
LALSDANQEGRWALWPASQIGFETCACVEQLGGLASPVLVFDDFRVRKLPFSPHPHAGFSAVTYVLEDSQRGLRSRTSLGNDIVVGPGGIVWTQAGRGVIHEEAPADADREQSSHVEHSSCGVTEQRYRTAVPRS